jgi:hypothetical protein
MARAQTIHAVQMVRRIRDRIARQTADMSTEELIAFFQAGSMELRKKMGLPPLTPPPKPTRAKNRPARKAPGTTD